jgi:hypothetical protein
MIPLKRYIYRVLHTLQQRLFVESLTKDGNLQFLKIKDWLKVYMSMPDNSPKQKEANFVALITALQMTDDGYGQPVLSHNPDIAAQQIKDFLSKVSHTYDIRR